MSITNMFGNEKNFICLFTDIFSFLSSLYHLLSPSNNSVLVYKLKQSYISISFLLAFAFGIGIGKSIKKNGYGVCEYILFLSSISLITDTCIP